MATSINLRLNDELEKRLKEKVEEVKAITPTGAEVNNSTVVRGALIEFFNRIDREHNGERNVSFNLRKLSDKDLEEMNKAFQTMCESIGDFEDKNPRVYFGAWRIMNSISIELLDELVKRKIESEDNIK